MGIHETIMRAAIADLVPIERRGSAYGIFNTLYGLSLFIGSAAMGFLYEVSITYIPVFRSGDGIAGNTGSVDDKKLGY